MTTARRTLLTLVAESGLEKRLTALVVEKGAHGYTVSGAYGQGPRPGHASDISGGNVRIETVVTREVAQAILQTLETDYFPHYALSCWLSDVEVIREDRY